MKRTIGIFAVATMLAGPMGCNSEEDEAAPELPPPASMSFDLTGFSEAPDDAKDVPPDGLTAAPEEHENFANAWVRVKVLEVVAVAVVVLPALSMAAALGQPAEQTSPTSWKWTVTVGNATAELEVAVGLVSGYDIDLFITNNELTRYLWVEGNFALDAKSGEWVIHDPNITDGPDDALSIQWTYVSDDSRTLTYEILSSASPDTGDTFTYRRTAGDEIHQDPAEGHIEYVDADDPGVTAVISWEIETGAGSIEVPGFNAGEPACWDTDFLNADC